MAHTSSTEIPADDLSLFPPEVFSSMNLSDSDHRHLRSESGEKSSLAFRTISEVASEIDVPQHVLRFWESRFAQIKPLKRAGGRRYYRPEDIELLGRIKNYLYKQGYTIKGVQRLLKEDRQMQKVSSSSAPKKNFVPYAHAMSSMPGHFVAPLKPLLNPTSLLQAAAAAPSALAMAYGQVSNTILEEGRQIRAFEQQAEKFADAFAEATSDTADKNAAAPAISQLHSSLEAVTQIRDEIAHPIQPLRVPATEDALATQTIYAETAETIIEAAPEMVLPEPILPEIVQPEVMETPVAEATVVDMMAVEITTVETTIEMAAPEPVMQAVAESQAMAAAHQAELKELLGELVALRQMLQTGTDI